VGTCDHLLDDSLLFAGRAAAAGVDVELFVLPELPHGFQMFDCGLTRACTAAPQQLMEWAQWLGQKSVQAAARGLPP
jgi:acetyl esterase/lipase